MVTTPPSNSKVRSSLSDRQTVSLGIAKAHSRRRCRETEGGMRDRLPDRSCGAGSLFGPGLKEEFPGLSKERPVRRRHAQRFFQVPGRLLGTPLLELDHPPPGAGLREPGVEPDRLIEIPHRAVEIPLQHADDGAPDQNPGVAA